MHNLVTYYLLMVRQLQVGQGLLTVEPSRSQSIHITPGKTPLHEWSAHSQKPLPDNTQQSQNILMEYITMCLDSTNKLEHWYVRHSKAHGCKQ